MLAKERATQTFWRNSRLALNGDKEAASKLIHIQECFKPDVSRLSQAATNSLTAASMRSGAHPSFSTGDYHE